MNGSLTAGATPSRRCQWQSYPCRGETPSQTRHDKCFESSAPGHGQPDSELPPGCSFESQPGALQLTKSLPLSLRPPAAPGPGRRPAASRRCHDHSSRSESGAESRSTGKSDLSHPAACRRNGAAACGARRCQCLTASGNFNLTRNLRLNVYYTLALAARSACMPPGTGAIDTSSTALVLLVSVTRTQIVKGGGSLCQCRRELQVDGSPARCTTT